MLYKPFIKSVDLSLMFLAIFLTFTTIPEDLIMPCTTHWVVVNFGLPMTSPEEGILSSTAWNKLYHYKFMGIVIK